MRVLTRFACFVAVLASVCVNAARMPSITSMPSIFEVPESAVASEAEEVSAVFPGSSFGEGLEALLLASATDGGAGPMATPGNGGSHKSWPIRITTKFLVRPAAHGKFVEEFRKFEEGSGDIKGIAHLSLNKVVGDNLVWSSYTVYEGFQALRDHIESKAVRKFGEFITRDNIVTEHHLLLKVGGCRSNALTCFEGPAVEATEGEDVTNKHKVTHPIRLITAYVVAQGRHRDFIQAWEELEAELSKSKGNLALALHKSAGDNILFLSYSAWKSPQDFWAAAKSDATARFIQFLGSEGVVAVTKKLWHVGPSTGAHRTY